MIHPRAAAETAPFRERSGATKWNGGSRAVARGIVIATAIETTIVTASCVSGKGLVEGHYSTGIDVVAG